MDFAQALLTAVTEQRNVNANTAAEAIAHLQVTRAELACAQARIAELEAQLAKE